VLLFYKKKNFVAKKKLFTIRTFLLALCRRPYPLPFGRIAFWPVGHVAARLWVSWVIGFMLRGRAGALLVAACFGSFGSLFFV
jgi:hypothetical protein